MNPSRSEPTLTKNWTRKIEKPVKSSEKVSRKLRGVIIYGGTEEYRKNLFDCWK